MVNAGWFRPFLALLALAGLLVACSDDDDGEDLATYCENVAAIETVGEPDVDFETATEEEITQAAKEHAVEKLKPLADEIREVAPEEIAEEVTVLTDAVDELTETGDFEATFETDEVNAASERVHQFDLENCDWNQVDVTAVEYAFQGLEDTEAGVTSFEFSNEGEEPHEFVLFRKNDGVTESAEELLALEQAEVETKVTFVAGTFAEPGDSDYAVAELEAGDYAAVCFIPVGGGEEGPPHFTEGMFAEFTVS